MIKNTFVISDTHFGHTNIIKLCNRPFTSVEEMDQLLINNWNSVVKFEDNVIFGGDFTFHKQCDIFYKLNGNKFLIVGNHDKYNTFNFLWENPVDFFDVRNNQSLFNRTDRLEIIYKGKYFVIDHYPLEDWNKRYQGSIHIHGHVHNKELTKIPNRFNMCVEVNNYTPINLDDIIEGFKEVEQRN